MKKIKYTKSDVKLSELVKDFVVEEVYKYIYLDGVKTHYKVSNYGNIVSTNYMNTGKTHLLKQNIDKDLYRTICIYLNGKPHTKKVHRLVAEAFVPNPDNKPEVNHKDSVPFHNWAWNLEYVTTAENIKYSFREHGNRGDWHGVNGSNTKYTEYAIRLACRQFELNVESMNSISNMTGVPKSTLYNILRKQQWTTISCDYKIDNYCLTDKTYYVNASNIDAICKELERGDMQIEEISDVFEVPYNDIYQISIGNTWKHVSSKYNINYIENLQNSDKKE